MEERFSKKDTNMIKGMAIIAMLFHHTHPNNPGISINVFSQFDITMLFAESAKVCVALLTILSGYGLAESYKNKSESGLIAKLRLFVSRYVQLLSIYWVILVFAYVLRGMQGISISQIYGEGIRGIKNLVIEWLGLAKLFETPMIIGDWYFMAIIVFYFLFPLMYFLLEKGRIVMLFVCYGPWIYYMLKGDINLSTDRWQFYLFSFSLGIYLSQKRILDKQKVASFKVGNAVLAVVFFLCALILRAYITLPLDPLVALSIIELFVIFIGRIPYVGSFFARCGSQSANMWLLHPFVLTFTYSIGFVSNTARFVFLMFLCMAISLVIEEIKIGTKYNECVKKIRRWIET